MSIAKYQVLHCWAIGDGTFAIAGDVEGEVPDIGSVGVSLSPRAGVSVEVLGIGRHAVRDAPDSRGLLVKVVAGEEKDLNGTTFEFGGETEACEDSNGGMGSERE